MRIIQTAAAYEGQMLLRFKAELDGYVLTVGDFLRPPVGRPHINYVLTSLRGLGFNLGAFERRMGMLVERWTGDVMKAPLKDVLMRSRDMDTTSLKQALGELYGQMALRMERPAVASGGGMVRLAGGVTVYDNDPVIVAFPSGEERGVGWQDGECRAGEQVRVTTRLGKKMAVPYDMVRLDMEAIRRLNMLTEEGLERRHEALEREFPHLAWGDSGPPL